MMFRMSVKHAKKSSAKAPITYQPSLFQINKQIAKLFETNKIYLTNIVF